jgi:hypothetical protein
MDGVCIGYWIYWHSCTHHSKLQVITALSLISTIHSSPQYTLSPFPACCVFTRCSLATAPNSGDSSASSPYAISSLTLVQNCLPTIYSGTLNPILCCNCQLPTISLPSLLDYTVTCQPRRLSQLSSTANSQFICSIPHYLPTADSQLTLIWSEILVIKPRTGPNRKHYFLTTRSS